MEKDLTVSPFNLVSFPCPLSIAFYCNDCKDRTVQFTNGNYSLFDGTGDDPDPNQYASSCSIPGRRTIALLEQQRRLLASGPLSCEVKFVYFSCRCLTLLIDTERNIMSDLLFFPLKLLLIAIDLFVSASRSWIHFYNVDIVLVEL